LLIAERFKNSNPDNILLYILDDDVADGFDVIKQHKLELDALVIGRNELAKWIKKNSQSINIIPNDDIESLRVIHIPPMTSKIQECKYCYTKDACVISAISLEANITREAPVG
jgi:hypothetical protein